MSKTPEAFTHIIMQEAMQIALVYDRIAQYQVYKVTKDDVFRGLIDRSVSRDYRPIMSILISIYLTLSIMDGKIGVREDKEYIRNIIKLAIEYSVVVDDFLINVDTKE